MSSERGTSLDRGWQRLLRNLSRSQEALFGCRRATPSIVPTPLTMLVPVGRISIVNRRQVTNVSPPDAAWFAVE